METKLSKFCLAIFMMTMCLSSKAETIVAIANKGSWNENTTWDLGRLPVSGDIIYIPYGIEVKVTENINFEKHGLFAPAIQLFVSGKLAFQDGDNLNLSENSTLTVSKTGSISKKGHHDKRSSFISIHLFKVWSSKQGNIAGPLVLGRELSSSQELLDFEVASISDTFVISWNIKQLNEAGYYELSVSKNGKNWESIKKMKAIHSDSVEKMLCHVYRASKTDHKLYFKLDVCDLNGNTSLLAAAKSERKPDQTKASFTIPKILMTMTVLKIISGIIHNGE